MKKKCIIFWLMFVGIFTINTMIISMDNGRYDVSLSSLAFTTDVFAECDSDPISNIHANEATLYCQNTAGETIAVSCWDEHEYFPLQTVFKRPCY